MISSWRRRFRALSDTDKERLLQSLSEGAEYLGADPEILQFYRISKKRAERNTNDVELLVGIAE